MLAVQKIVQKMTSQGINKIIGLGHAGYNFDLKLAKEIPEIDIVVGGHTDTFLYSGKYGFSN